MYTSSEIGFPGLGIEGFKINRTAFTVFGRDVAWYGIIIALGMVLAVLYVMYRTKEYKGITVDDVIDFTLFIIISGVIGARLYYVITSDYNYSFAEVFAIWEGGLAIYGGIIAGGTAAVLVCLYKKIRPLCFLDMLAPAVMLGQIIGRWGNFCNGEAFGYETTLPWGMELTHIMESGAERYIGIMHPTFLYESLWNVTGFCFIHFLFNKKKKYDGQILLLYVAWYGLGRMMIEGLRTDSLYVGNTGIRISQIVALVCLIAGGALLIYFALVPKKTAIADCIYLQGTDKYNKVMGIDTVSEEEKDSKDSPAENTESINEKSPDPTDESGKESNNE